jgi:hypothetical protein
MGFDHKEQHLYLKVRGNLVWSIKIHNRISGLIDEDTESDRRMIV